MDDMGRTTGSKVPEDAVVMGDAGHRGISGADGQVNVRLPGLGVHRFGL